MSGGVWSISCVPANEAARAIVDLWFPYLVQLRDQRADLTRDGEGRVVLLCHSENDVAQERAGGADYWNLERLNYTKNAESAGDRSHCKPLTKFELNESLAMRRWLQLRLLRAGVLDVVENDAAVFLVLKGLDDVSMDVELRAIDDIVFCLQGRCHDDFCGTVLHRFPDFLEQGIACHDRHHNIENNNVRPPLLI